MTVQYHPPEVYELMAQIDYDSIVSNKSYRYPCPRNAYTHIVGSLREAMIRIVLEEELGFKVKKHKVSENGVDIIAEYVDGRILALEILNERESSYIDSKRAICIKRNLKGFKYKGIVKSFEIRNKEASRILRNVPILRVGFQSLPSLFFDFYSKKKITGIKLANKSSLKLLKNRILSFLYRIKFFLPMYIKARNYTRSSYNNFKNDFDCKVNRNSVQKNSHEQRKLTDFLGFQDAHYSKNSQENQSLQKAMPRILTCKECRLFNECKLADELKQIKNKIDQTSRVSNKTQYMSLVKEFFNMKDKLLRCLRRRRYCHNILEYYMFHEPYDESASRTVRVELR